MNASVEPDASDRLQGRTDPTDSPWPRIWRVVLVLSIIGLLCAALWPRGDTEKESTEALMLKVFKLHKPVDNKLAAQFTDSDNDLVADPPSDAAKLADPPELVFSYVASANNIEEQTKVWKEFVDDLAKRTGRPVKQVTFVTVDEQLKALYEGKLHITAFNTGNVPFAVNACGFVPVSAPGGENGQAGITMQWIVPAASTLQKPADIKDHKFMFTDLTSNSGFKAPAVFLLREFNLAPERDYKYGFSYSHEDSIRRICTGEFEVAAVASDMVARALADPASGIKAEQFRVIYDSPRFPPAALGYAYNLKPELAVKVRESLLQFTFAGTGLEKEFGASTTRFVPVDYKADFAVVRQIDDSLGRTHAVP